MGPGVDLWGAPPVTSLPLNLTTTLQACPLSPFSVHADGSQPPSCWVQPLVCPVLVPTSQEGSRQSGEGPEEGQNDGQSAGEPAVGGKAEGVWSLLPGEKTCEGTSSQ